MTEISIPVLTVLIGGVVTIIGAAAAAGVTIIKALSELRRELVTVSRDTEAIKGHVNSEKTASDGRELALKREIELLREVNNGLKQAAALLAQAAASRTREDPTGVITPRGQ